MLDHAAIQNMASPFYVWVAGKHGFKLVSWLVYIPQRHHRSASDHGPEYLAEGKHIEAWQHIFNSNAECPTGHPISATDILNGVAKPCTVRIGEEHNPGI